MGIFAILPVALAPAMGLNAFFAFVVVGAMGISGRPGWAQYSGAQLDYFAHAVSRIRYWMISNISLSLRIGITSGIDYLSPLMGLKYWRYCRQ